MRGGSWAVTEVFGQVKYNDQTVGHVLQIIWNLLKGWAGAIVAILAAIYYGPRKILETWDWYLDRWYDSAVLNVVRRKIPTPVANQNNYSPYVRAYESHGTAGIAKELGRQERSVRKSLHRLVVRGKVVSSASDTWSANS
jgi:hypothetical protein